MNDDDVGELALVFPWGFHGTGTHLGDSQKTPHSP